MGYRDLSLVYSDSQTGGDDSEKQSRYGNMLQRLSRGYSALAEEAYVTNTHPDVRQSFSLNFLTYFMTQHWNIRVYKH